eukprot:gb/GECG01007169.1/.p1 GENE.gb/GECG01007169.1/~~gb/GECG01007169.1/.p1  ORF type:complete len:258 (+),score=45.86 gb/GECG01007169.1/:1-774(+)
MALVPHHHQQQHTSAASTPSQQNEVVIPAPQTILADPRHHSGVTNDALPYVDREYDDSKMAEYVDGLVQQEMDTMAREENISLKDYEARLPAYPSTREMESNPLIKNEMDRIARNEPMPQLDMSRYEPDKQAPQTEKEKNDPDAWQHSIDRLKTQLESKLIEHLNLELVNKYGADGFKRNADTIEQIKNRYQHELEEIRKRSDILNKRRKRKQEEAAPRLQTLYRRWMETVDTNFHTELACLDMEKQVKRMRASNDE